MSGPLGPDGRFEVPRGARFIDTRDGLVLVVQHLNELNRPIQVVWAVDARITHHERASVTVRVHERTRVRAIAGIDVGTNAVATQTWRV